MSDAGDMAATAANAAEPVIRQAAAGSVGALAFIVIVGIVILGGVYIWRNPRNLANVDLPTCPPSGCTELQVVLSEIRHINDRFDESQTSRRTFYDRMDARLARLDERIDETEKRAAPRGEFDAAMKLIAQAQEETNSLLRSTIHGAHQI